MTSRSVTSLELAGAALTSRPRSANADAATQPPLAVDDLAAVMRAHTRTEPAFALSFDAADTVWIVHGSYATRRSAHLGAGHLQLPETPKTPFWHNRRPASSPHDEGGSMYREQGAWRRQCRPRGPASNVSADADPAPREQGRIGQRNGGPTPESVPYGQPADHCLRVRVFNP